MYSPEGHGSCLCHTWAAVPRYDRDHGPRYSSDSILSVKQVLQDGDCNHLVFIMTTNNIVSKMSLKSSIRGEPGIMGHLTSTWSTDFHYSTRVLKFVCRPNIYLIIIFIITSEGFSGAKIYFEYSHK